MLTSVPRSAKCQVQIPCCVSWPTGSCSRASLRQVHPGPVLRQPFAARLPSGESKNKKTERQECTRPLEHRGHDRSMMCAAEMAWRRRATGRIGGSAMRVASTST